MLEKAPRSWAWQCWKEPRRGCGLFLRAFAAAAATRRPVSKRVDWWRKGGRLRKFMGLPLRKASGFEAFANEQLHIGESHGVLCLSS